MAEPFILIVEDDASVAEGVKRTLRADGLAAEAVSDGHKALDWLVQHTPDLIIADIMMPGMNGYQLFQRVRSNPDWVRIPFVFLTARADAEDIRYGKELGVDDYLTKPIEPEDLVAAVRGRLARFRELSLENGHSPSRNRLVGEYQAGSLIVNFSTHQARIAGQEIRLSPTEFTIVHNLILAEGAVVDYDQLLGEVDERTLDEKDAAELVRYHMRNLRQKIEAAGGDANLIENARGVGYRLIAKPSRI